MRGIDRSPHTHGWPVDGLRCCLKLAPKDPTDSRHPPVTTHFSVVSKKCVKRPSCRTQGPRGRKAIRRSQPRYGDDHTGATLTERGTMDADLWFSSPVLALHRIAGGWALGRGWVSGGSQLIPAFIASHLSLSPASPMEVSGGLRRRVLVQRRAFLVSRRVRRLSVSDIRSEVQRPIPLRHF